MSSAEKLRLRKELEGFHPAIKAWKRDDLVLGRWFAQFIDRTLGAIASPPSPVEVKEKYPGNDTQEDLADDVVSGAIHQTIAISDAYSENLSATEINKLRDRKPGGDQKLTGDTIALMAEVVYSLKIMLDMLFQLAAAHERQLNAGQVELVEEIFGRALGAFDYDAAKKKGNALDQIGAKIYDRAISQTVGLPIADAQRKGFYCFFAKAVGKELRRSLDGLPKWEPPKESGPATGAMMSASPSPSPSPSDEPPAFET